jgi:exodeoxyribonuclease VII small subunit
MVAAFAEGQKLVKLCSSKLDEVEKKIELLVKNADGTVGTEPFETEKN